MRDDRVPGIWKWVATLAVGIILGGAPAYVSLLIDRHDAITRKDVDTEIELTNAPIIVSITDLKDRVQELGGKIDALKRLEK